MDKKSILIFGVGELQKSIINRAKLMGLYTVGIDPCANAICKNEVDAFEVVNGQDYEETLAVAEKYNISAVVTAATDKPLVMMARIAKELGLRFYSVDTAIWSTDKYLMKQRFIEGGIPCARGKVIKSVDETKDLDFPLILKPRDNSGSRGVILCYDMQTLQDAMEETLQYTHMDSVLVEEFIEGPEYSIESLHYNGKSEIIQFTEKRTSPHPYNVELGHIQPAQLDENIKKEIHLIIDKIGKALKFENCPSHTELKINNRGIYVIETSPRLGGGYITSTLVPLSTNINIEDLLLKISIGEQIDIQANRVDRASAVRFFSFPESTIVHIDDKIHNIEKWPHLQDFRLDLKSGDIVNRITTGLNRYGHFIVEGNNYQKVVKLIEKYNRKIESYIIFT